MNENKPATADTAASFDVLVLGAGLAGIFAAWELTGKRPDLRVAVVEEGYPLEGRHCPIVDGQVKTCANCSICAIMHGFGGAGAFSDGKFNFTTAFGGWLSDYLPDTEVMSLIDEVDRVNQSLGATQETHSTFSPEAEVIRRRALSYDIHLLNARVKHLGTDRNREVLARQYAALAARCTMLMGTRVEQIVPYVGGQPMARQRLKQHMAKLDPARLEALKASDAEQEHAPVRRRRAAGSLPEKVDRYVLKTNKGDISGTYLIAGPGRAGAEWFANECRALGLTLTNNQVDLGVRVELPALVFKEITDAMYEAKLKYLTKGYKDIVRTFCMNPYGYVVTENTDGIMTVNGHSYEDPALRSENTNFALLVSNRFTEPFNEPYQYGKHIASLSNMLGGGIIMQRFGDLMDGRRTTLHRMQKSFVRPTLDATPGDLSLVLPKRHLDNIVEMIQVLDKLAPGTANADTLLYGVEVKFYSSRLALKNTLETELPGFYAVGDGAGITRGLSQAGASGIHAARSLLARLGQAGPGKTFR